MGEREMWAALVLVALLSVGCMKSEPPPTMLYGDLLDGETRFILTSTDRYDIKGSASGSIHVILDTVTGQRYVVTQSVRAMAITPLLGPPPKGGE